MNSKLQLPQVFYIDTLAVVFNQPFFFQFVELRSNGLATGGGKLGNVFVGKTQRYLPLVTVAGNDAAVVFGQLPEQGTNALLLSFTFTQK